LAEEPMHGYQIIQELSSRTHGMWQPSPGAIYPTLQQLDDEGLVKVEEREGKKVYALTPAGRARVGNDEAPWERLCPEPRSDLVGLRDLAFSVGAAVMQVVHTGTESQLSRTKELLEETRRRIYEVLAETETE
jgi:DNA-binding PadR family transcriptional regulator